MKDKRLLKYRKYLIARQYLKLLHLLRPRHVMVVLPMSGKANKKAFKHIKRLIHKGYFVQIR